MPGDFGIEMAFITVRTALVINFADAMHREYHHGAAGQFDRMAVVEADRVGRSIGTNSKECATAD